MAGTDASGFGFGLAPQFANAANSFPSGSVRPFIKHINRLANTADNALTHVQVQALFLCSVFNVRSRATMTFCSSPTVAVSRWVSPVCFVRMPAA